MSDRTILLVQDNNAYFYNLEKKCIQPMKINMFTGFIRYLSNLFGIIIPRVFLNKKIFCADKIVFTDSAFHIGIYKCLCKYISRDAIYLYYLNTISESTSKYIKYFSKENIYTFDIDDAEKYGVRFKHTPYSSKIVCEKKIEEYDAIFIGRSKSREDTINHVYDMFNKKKLKTKFMVLGSANSEIAINEYVDYFSYIDLVSKSRAIIEINEKNQAGCSLRMMEALFLKKKLITNNISIVKDPYYSRSNVFILGKNNEAELETFIKEECDNEVDLTKLDFEKWICTF